MIDVTAVNKQLLRAIADATGETEKEIRTFAEKIYDNILSSPAFITGYYRSNHRIIVRDEKGRFKTAGTAKLSPTQKPSDAGPASLDISAQTRNEEFAKLKNFKIGDIITITTRVPYAEDVERNHGTYAGARALVGS